jgi:hypothetical protein
VTLAQLLAPLTPVVADESTRALTALIRACISPIGPSRSRAISTSRPRSDWRAAAGAGVHRATGRALGNESPTNGVGPNRSCICVALCRMGRLAVCLSLCNLLV